MRQMQPTEIMPFLERFYYCMDGTVKTIILHEAGLCDPEGYITLHIYCQDQEKEFGEWCSLTIELRGIHKFQFKGSDRQSNWIFFNGIFIVNENERWGLDTGDRYDFPKTMKELEESPGFIIAKEIWWEAKL